MSVTLVPSESQNVFECQKSPFTSTQVEVCFDHASVVLREKECHCGCTKTQTEGEIIGFDECMIVTLEDAVEIQDGKQTKVGCAQLKGDSTALLQEANVKRDGILGTECQQ